jgi:hypothetical protein
MATLHWQEANRQHLDACIERLRLRLQGTQKPGASPDEASERAHAAEAAVERAAALLERPSTQVTLAELFALSAFERDVLLLAAAFKLNPSFAREVAAAYALPSVAPSFDLAFRVLDTPHWSAVAPTAPLRHHRLVELEQPADPLYSALHISERVLFFLLAIPTSDARLDGLLAPVPAPATLPGEGYAQAAKRLAALWADDVARPVVQMCGRDPEGARAIAAVGCAELGFRLFALHGADVPGEQGPQLHLGHFARLLDRELLLAGACLLVVTSDDHADESRAVRSLVSQLRIPVIVVRREPLQGLRRPEVRVDVEGLDADEQRRLWRQCAGPALQGEERAIEEVVGHFRFGPTAIRAASAALVSADGAASGPAAGARLWEICRRQGRYRLPDLAQRLESRVGWDDLVLPGPQKQVLRSIAAQVVQKTQVHERWGFGARSGRALGLGALFYGDSGTGKTLAAEVIANEVRMDLWRVDISRVLDKYIGETEKNLRRIFDAAEESGAVLLFDEADALFNQRSDVRDSVDRYANVEVAYLLQRMEGYRGLAILTTNLHRSIDHAFKRRIRYFVEFPFPNVEQRALIWMRAFPPGAPTDRLDPSLLAQLTLPGGNIHNIALNAAFLAAADGRAIGMEHVLSAARNECQKLDRPLPLSEIAGWQ